MAVTKSPISPKRPGAITLAALALPGVMVTQPTNAFAETAPDEGVLTVKLQAYNDSQPGLERIKVIAPSLYVFLPIAGAWSLEATVVQDNISGASPRWHTSISGASHMRIDGLRLTSKSHATLTEPQWVCAMRILTKTTTSRTPSP